MAWFKGFSARKKDAQEQAREALELLDPYNERTTSVRDGRVVSAPGQILENLAQRMERIDLDPETPWAVEDLVSEDELSVMFVQLPMGEMFVTETAWFARRILARWPAELVEHPIAEEARIGMFVDGVTVAEDDDVMARRILNRALVSRERVEAHPELDGDLHHHKLVAIWMALVFWFGIKSGSLNQMCGPERGESR